MPSELETAMESLIKVFHRYASKEGRSGTLNRRELRELMENELSTFLMSQKDPAAVDKIMKDLDTNGDGQVDFEEFVSLVVGLSIACEQCYQMHMKKTSIIMSVSKLQMALGLLVTTFDEYASKDGDNKRLTKAEVKDLLKGELKDLLGKATDQAAVDSIFNKLDLNHDNSVDFEEFIIMFAAVATALHDVVTSS
ncbi:hypothetical protein ABVT39_018010 [Epinephelus coioides]